MKSVSIGSAWLEAIKACLMAVGVGLLTSCCCPQHGSHCRHQPVFTQTGQMPEPWCQPSRLSASPIQPPYANPLPVVTMVQEGFYSCWSTCAEMIMYSHGLRVPQCVQASPANHQCSCCDKWRLWDQCDQASYPDFQRWGFAAKLQYPQPLSWEEVTAEIDAGRPFAFALTENSSSGTMSHMMVAIGYKQPEGPKTRMLVCLNPRFSTFAEEEDVMFTDYLGTGAIIPATGGTATPTAVISDYTHQMTYSGVLR